MYPVWDWDPLKGFWAEEEHFLTVWKDESSSWRKYYKEQVWKKDFSLKEGSGLDKREAVRWWDTVTQGFILKEEIVIPW